MKTCPFCGRTALDTDRYCTECGGALTETKSASAPAGDNQLILVSYENAQDVLSLMHSLLGYSFNDARDLIQTLPCQIADNLNEQQADILASAFAQKGAQMSIYGPGGYRNVDASVQQKYQQEASSNGNVIAWAAGLLGIMGAANRILSPRPWGGTIPGYSMWGYGRPAGGFFSRLLGLTPPPAPRRNTPGPMGPGGRGPGSFGNPAGPARRPSSARGFGGMGGPGGRGPGSFGGPGRGGFGGPGGRGGFGGPGGHR